MTITDIIKALPMDDKLRMQVLNMYPYMEKVEKFEIERVAWQSYMAIFKQRLDTNMQLKLQNAADGKEEVDTDLYPKAVKETEQEMEQVMKEGLEKYDLTAARSAMQKIVDEINAAKKQKTTSQKH